MEHSTESYGYEEYSDDPPPYVLSITRPHRIFLNLDIILLILQVIVDEEADRCRGRIVGEGGLGPKAIFPFTRVCRIWRDTIYGCSSLWPTISLNFMEPLEAVRTKCNQLVNLAKNSPKDLYLWRIHLHENRLSYANHDIKKEQEYCACQNGRMSLSLAGMTSLRSLHMEFASVPSWDILDISLLPPLSHLHTLCLTGVDWAHRDFEYDLQPLLSHTPRLEVLNIASVHIVKLDLALNQRHLLPKLRSLQLSNPLEHPTDRNILVKFLSHTPNVENINLNLSFRTVAPGPDLINFPNFILPKLRELGTNGFAPLVDIFSRGMILTPALEEFHYYEWNNTFNYHCQRFLAANSTIKRITLRVADQGAIGPGQEARYEVLYAAPNVEELSIHGYGEGECLKSLSLRGPASRSRNILPICPQLKRLKISMEQPLRVPFFEEMVLARCIPIDDIGEFGYTAAGCMALEVLTFSMEWASHGSEQLMENYLWRKADVTKISKMTFELRWRYHEYEENNEWDEDGEVPGYEQSVSSALKIA